MAFAQLAEEGEILMGNAGPGVNVLRASQAAVASFAP
jgi:hypothetical protein